MVERKPMMTDNAIFGRRNKSGRRVPMAGFEVRDHYETLITQGRLRVVKECVLLDDPEWPGSKQLGCNGRGPITDEEFCPYCGNLIKR